MEACSDADTSPKPPWRERKERYIAHLQHADHAVLRVALADKLHNARAIVLDYRTLGGELWSRFNAKRDDILWYYRSVLAVLNKRLSSPLVGELARTIDELEGLIAAETAVGGHQVAERG